MKRALCLLLAVSLLALSGCSTPITSADRSGVTLPPASAPYACPEDDASLGYVARLPVYLPSRDGRRLISRVSDVSLTRGVSPARAAALAVLTASPDDDMLAPGRGEVHLQFYGSNPVEISSGVCTVNLNPSALELESDDLYDAALALVSTLSAAADVRYMNLLVADQAVSYDVAGNLPAGCIAPHPGEELAALWDQLAARRTHLGDDPATVPLTETVTLYYPLADGGGFLPETRNLSFPGQTPRQLAAGLIDALSAGPQYMEGITEMPDIAAMLARGPEISELAEGGRLVTLVFTDDLPSRLAQLGIDTASFVGSLVWTLTTFIPSVGAVRVISGASALTGLESPVFGTLSFSDGLIRRRIFRDFLRDQATVYLASGTRLRAAVRALPGGMARDPRALLAELMAQPASQETEAGLACPLPAGLGPEDVLAVGAEGDTLLVSLSQRFADRLTAAGPEGEQAACYSMVVTLCEALGMTRVRFFFGGRVAETLAGSIFWSGEFMLDRSLIDDNRG